MAERSLEELVGEARRAVRDEQWGPLEGPWGPAGSGGLVRTASGRSPEVAASEGPVGPPTTGEVPPEGRAPAGEGLVSRLGLLGNGVTAGPAEQTTSGRVERMELSPEVLEAAAALLREQQVVSREPQVQQVSLEGPPPGYRPPQDGERVIPTLETEGQVSAAVTLLRLFEEGPALVRQAIPRTDNQQVSRARSIVIRALDDARLWMREALEQQEEGQAGQGPGR